MNKTPYVPIDRLHALARGVTLPDRMVGTALYADIAGFTPLAEQLRQCFGPQRGAEELTRYSDAIFRMLIEPVHHYGGSVITFSGDAITCWFDHAQLAHPALSAAAAALRQQAAVGAAPMIRLPDGQSATLQVKVALASGPVRRFVVGDPALQTFDVLAGATLLRLAHGESLTHPGEILIDIATEQALNLRAEVGQARTDSTGQAFYQLAGLTNDAAPAPWEDSPVLSDAVLRPWLPPSVNARLDAGLGEFITELRPASVLFARFDGIAFDHDNAESQLDQFIRRAALEIARLDGTLLQITIGEKGSYIYAAFGAPIVHEDDAARAALAAIALRALPRELPFLAALQIGLAKGNLHAGAGGSPARRTYSVLGDEVNLAARLMQHAGLHTILASESLRAATGDAFVWESLPPLRVKGKAQPIAVVQLRSSAKRAGRRPRPAPSASALVGRTAEQATLADALSRLVQGQSGIVVIEGQAGIGKSRLIANLLQQAQAIGLPYLVGIADAVAQTTPYHAWQSVFATVLGLDGAPPQPDGVGVLAALNADPRIAPWLPLLRVVVPLELPDTEATAQLAGDARAEQTIRVLANVLAAAFDQPIVVVLEDAHWMDSASWNLALRVSRNLGRILLILVTRPAEAPSASAYHQIRAASQTRLVQLDTLNTTESLALVCQRLGVSDLPEPIASLIWQKTEGHPFFAEEFAFALRDAGLIHIRDGRCELAVSPTTLAATRFPDTVQGIVTSRIDRLPLTQQLALKVASVIGRVFGFNVLSTVFPITSEEASLARDLHALEQLDLTPLATPDPHLAYRFKHVITQEAAYNLLLFAQRRNLHAAVAAWYERTLSEEQATARAGLLAYHWQAAEVADKAIIYLDRAGMHSLQNGIYQEAAAFFRRALALASQSSTDNQPFAMGTDGGIATLEQARRERLLAETLLGLGQMAESLQHAAHALALLGCPIPIAPFPQLLKTAREFVYQLWSWVHTRQPADTHPPDPADVERIEAYLICWRVAYYDSQASLVVYANLHALNLAAHHPNLPHQAPFLVGAGVLAGFIGMTPAMHAYLRRAGHAARTTNNPTQIALINLLSGVYHSGLGQWEHSQAYLRTTRAISEAQRDWRSWMDAMLVQAFNWYYQGEFARSQAILHLVEQIARERSGGQIVAGAIGGQGLIALRQGRLELAIVLLEQTAATAGATLLEINAYGTLALAAWRLGRTSVARTSADRAAQLIARTTPVSFIAMEGYAGVAEIALALWRQSPYDYQLARSARQACRSLRYLSWAFPIAQPQAWRWQGDYHWMCGRRREALNAWQTSIRIATQLAMPYEAGRAHAALAAHLPSDHRQRQSHLEQATTYFTRLSAQYDLADIAKLDD